jgi:hypothetical protein
MATDYKALLDMLKPQEEEPMMSEMAPADYENMQSPVVPEMLYSTPKLADALPAKPQQPEVPMLAEADTQQQPPVPETPMSKSEALIAEYQKMLGRDQQALEDARSRDRMLKVGGALGDALSTYLNAQSQMNVKAPGVQVQQGAGLGKVADMFATAPEIASDVAARRAAMLKQYSELAKGERSAADRTLRERQIAAYEAQTKAQAKKAEAETGRQESKERLAQEREDRLARSSQLNAARGLLKDDPRAKKALEQGMALESIEPLLKEIESGNEIAIQSLGTQLARAMGEVGVLTDTDVIRYVQGTSWGRKLKDWWARGAEGGLPKDAIDGIRKNIKAINTNLNKNLNSVYSKAAGQMKTAYPDLDEATINGLLGTPALKQQTEETKTHPITGKKLKKVPGGWEEVD